jgi:molybdopterin converting factor small subunit
MKLHVKCFASLAKTDACRYDEKTEHEIEDGATVEMLMEQMGIPDKNIKIAFVNGIAADRHRQLNDGEAVTFVPPSGGM